MKTTRGNNFSKGNIREYGEYGMHGKSEVVREKKFCQDTGISYEITAVLIERNLLSAVKLLSGFTGSERETYLMADAKMERLLDFFSIEKTFEWKPARITRRHPEVPAEAFSIHAFESFLQSIAKAERDEPGVSFTELSIFLGCSHGHLKTFIRHGILNAAELSGPRRGREKYSFVKIKADDNLRALLLSVGAIQIDDDCSDIEMVQRIITGAIEKNSPALSIAA